MPIIRKSKGRYRERISDSEFDKYYKYIQWNTQFRLWGIELDEVFTKIRKKKECTLSDFMSCLLNLGSTWIPGW